MKKEKEKEQEAIKNRYAALSLNNAFYKSDSKLVAKSMTFLRELSEEEIYTTFKDIELNNSSYYELVNSIDDFKKYRFKSKKELKKIRQDKTYQTLVDAGYSSTYATVLTNSIYNYDSLSYRKQIISLAIAYADEEISHDMRAYLLSSYLK